MPENHEKTPFLGLSLTQLIGGSAAAATAAILGSRLGTAGTILGAALVSVVSAVATAAYTASLRRTREVVARTRALLPTATWRAQQLPDVPAEPDGSEADVAGLPADQENRSLDRPIEESIEESVDELTPSVWSRITWRTVAVTAAVIFVITAALVTGTELVTGHSLSGDRGTTATDAFRGNGSHPSRPAHRPSTPAPTTQVPPTVSPSAVPTQTPTTTPTPSGEPTPAETPTLEPPTPTNPPTP